MSKTIIVAGFGPGIAAAVAAKFGSEGYAVALVARNAERLAAGVKQLEAQGVKAAAFPCDLADPSAVRELVQSVRTKLGPVTALHWNAYPTEAGDLLTADTAALHRVFDVAVGGLVAAVQEALPDMKADAKNAAVLITNGGFARIDVNVEAYSAKANHMGISIANAAKHKLTGLLSAKLAADGIYVGEVMVLGTVKGTAWDTGNGTLEASAIADKFWSMFQDRSEIRGHYP
jgi:NADP-dependent 3-hydroxy acid dehydrogenase YdfG